MLVQITQDAGLLPGDPFFSEIRIIKKVQLSPDLLRGSADLFPNRALLVFHLLFAYELLLLKSWEINQNSAPGLDQFVHRTSRIGGGCGRQNDKLGES